MEAIATTLTTSKISKAAIRMAMAVTFLAIGIVAPFAGNQIVTGTIVNATLISTAYLVGLPEALVVAFGPSLISLMIGKLPLPLAPMIPLIILSNLFLILVFKFFSKQSNYLAAATASVAKFVFLFLTSSVLVAVMHNPALTKVASMMGSIQLLTALMGSALALAFLKLVKQMK
jgi:hypothetical protein